MAGLARVAMLEVLDIVCQAQLISPARRTPMPRASAAVVLERGRRDAIGSQGEERSRVAVWPLTTVLDLQHSASCPF